MNDRNRENPTCSETSTRGDLEHGPTNALTVNTQQMIDRATRINIGNDVPIQIYSDRLLRIEFQIHKLEERIIVGRQLLATETKDPAEIQEYVTAASTVYNQHMTKMLRLSHINAKIKRPPSLPIMFSTQETSELYWTLVQFGTIDSVVTQVEHGLKQNMSRLLMIPPHATRPEDHNLISGGVRLIVAALRQWRTNAQAAIHGRCMAIQSMIAAEMMEVEQRGGSVDVQDDRGCLGSGEMDFSRHSPLETIVLE